MLNEAGKLCLTASLGPEQWLLWGEEKVSSVINPQTPPIFSSPKCSSNKKSNVVTRDTRMAGAIVPSYINSIFHHPELNTVLIPSLPWENQDKESLSNLPRFKSQKGVELGSSPGHLDAELMVHVLGHLCIKPQASESVGHSPVLKLVWPPCGLDSDPQELSGACG